MACPRIRYDDDDEYEIEKIRKLLRKKECPILPYMEEQKEKKSEDFLENFRKIHREKEFPPTYYNEEQKEKEKKEFLENFGRINNFIKQAKKQEKFSGDPPNRNDNMNVDPYHSKDDDNKFIK